VLVNLPLLLCLRGVRDRAPQPSEAVGKGSGGGVLGRSLGSVLAVFVALYVLHVGVETGVGGWEPTHLETVGYGAGVAATATSVFWLMMTVGRFLVAPITLRFSAQAIITVSCAGMTVCLLLAAIPGLAPYAYAGVGLFIAPIFPTGLPWLHRAAPRARRAGALVIAASMTGGVVAGPALGKAIEWSGIRAVPLLLAGVSALCLAATLWLARDTRPSRSAW
jgi:MFS transporter, FHS family, glucose/mannose:H+ symporter